MRVLKGHQHWSRVGEGFHLPDERVQHSFPALLRGKLAACTYFFHYELPRIDAWLKVVETRDPTCRDMAEEWF